MKKLVCLAAAIAASSLISSSSAAPLEAGAIDFGGFKPTPGAEFVEVNINSNLITMVTNFARKHEPEIAEVLQGLKSIRVNVLGMNDSNRAEIEKRIHALRSQLDQGGWDRIVTVMQDQQDVGIFMKTKGAEAVEGLVVTVFEGTKQAVVVNIIGNIRPEKLATVGERFNIEPLKHLPAKPDETKSE